MSAAALSAALTADQIIAALDLAPHPEGGWFRETWRAEAPADARPGKTAGARPTGTAIYFLLKAGERSHWHRVDATEIWLYHAGAPLALRMAAKAPGPASLHRLGPDLTSGAHPQIIVPADHWQSAESLGDYTLVSCTVSPGFDFEGFELAPPDFDIPG